MKKSSLPWKDIAIGAAVGVALLGFLLFGILSMHKTVSDRRLVGTIIEKEFRPLAQTQITVGRGGLHRKKVSGEFILKVEVPTENRTFHVWVGEAMYHAHEVGDTFTFIRPPEEPPPGGASEDPGGGESSPAPSVLPTD
jgi:hypothetical protein